MNRPPLVEAGVEKTVEINTSVPLDGKVYDDSITGKLDVRWSVYFGEAVFENDTSPATTVRFATPGLHSLRLSASDGEYESYDLVNIRVNNPWRIDITSPTRDSIWHAGQTVSIRWSASEVENVVIEYSYNGGLSFYGIFDEVILPSDALWGNAPWTIPDDAPQTSQAIIRLGTYSRTITAESEPFSILSP